MVEVESGLEGGDVVVTAGHQKLRPGATVVLEPHRPVENPNLALGGGGALEGCES
jgi:hypothetical protein